MVPLEHGSRGSALSKRWQTSACPSSISPIAMMKGLHQAPMDYHILVRRSGEIWKRALHMRWHMAHSVFCSMAGLWEEQLSQYFSHALHMEALLQPLCLIHLFSIGMQPLIV